MSEGGPVRRGHAGPISRQGARLEVMLHAKLFSIHPSLSARTLRKARRPTSVPSPRQESPPTDRAYGLNVRGRHC